MKATHIIAVAALLAPLCAHADLRLSTRGTGDALYLPYYSVNDELSTLIAVANTSDQPKAIRLNFVEALNGQRVLSFNIYLGARDSWSAAVLASGAEGPAHLLTQDASCTAPQIAGVEMNFVRFAYADTYADGGPVELERTRTGAIEIIEMGVPGGFADDAIADGDCAALNTALVSGDWAADPNAGMGAPGGGISASAMLVDVAAGTVYATPALAIHGFGARPHHSLPAAEFPRISHPVAATEGANFQVQLPDGGTATVEGSRAPDAISALFMAGSLIGDFHIDPALGASTDWIVSFPTRHAYVAQVPGSLVGADSEPVAPFTEAFGADGACEALPTATYDMDGETVQLDPPQQATLCAQVQRMTLAEAGEQPLLEVHGDSGRAELRLVPNRPPLELSTSSLHGLPVVGFALHAFVNGEAQAGVLANYTVALPLVTTPPAVVDGQ